MSGSPEVGAGGGDRGWLNDGGDRVGTDTSEQAAIPPKTFTGRRLMPRCASGVVAFGRFRGAFPLGRIEGKKRDNTQVKEIMSFHK